MFFPARIAYQWFVPEPVKLGGIGGSVWSGQAGEGLVAGIYFTDLKWSFKPLSLLTGHVAFDTSVTTTAGKISMATAVGITGNVSLTDFVGSLSLADIHPALRANRIEGSVNIQLQKLVLSDGWPTEAHGSVGIGNLVAGAIGPDTLGNFRADITTEDSGIVGKVKDTGAVLNVTGTLQLSEDRSYSLVGFVSANGETPAMINQNLRFLGTPDQNGQRQFRFEGSL
jgi:general secretion pathway protein N